MAQRVLKKLINIESTVLPTKADFSGYNRIFRQYQPEVTGGFNGVKIGHEATNGTGFLDPYPNIDKTSNFPGLPTVEGLTRYVASALYANNGVEVTPNETWKYGCKDLHNTRYTKSSDNQKYNNVPSGITKYQIKDYQVSKVWKYPIITGTGIRNSFVADETHIYIVQTDSVRNIQTAASYYSQKLAAAFQAVIQNLLGIGLTNFPKDSVIVKLNRLTLEADAVKIIREYHPAITVYSESMCLVGDYMYFATKLNKNAILKVNKNDLSLVWLYDMPALYDESKPYILSAETNIVNYIPASGSRSAKIIAQFSQKFQYSITSGGLQGILSDEAIIANARLRFADNTAKINPGWYQDNGYMIALEDNGNSAQQVWRFDVTPKFLRGGDKLPKESFTYIDDNGNIADYLNIRTNIIDNLLIKGTDSNGIVYSDSPSIGTISLQGLQNFYINLANGQYLAGNAVLSNLNAHNPAETAELYINLLDTYNTARLKNIGNSYFFDASATYKAYPLVNKGTSIHNYGVAKHVDLREAVSVLIPGSMLLTQPIVKTIGKNLINIYTISTTDAYHLNYFGGGLYGNYAYDEVNDLLYFPTGQGNFAPLQHQLDNELSSYVPVDSSNPYDIAGEYTGRQYSNWSYYVNNLWDINTGAKLSDASATLLFNAVANRELWKRNNVRGSARSNRYLHSSVVALRASTGELVWADKTESYDTMDWDQLYAFFTNYSYAFFSDKGNNGDMMSCVLAVNPIDNKRVLCSIGKDVYAFHQIDSPALASNFASTKLVGDDIFCSKGLSKFPKANNIGFGWWPTGPAGFAIFEGAATDGINFIAKQNNTTLPYHALPGVEFDNRFARAVRDPQTNQIIQVPTYGTTINVFDLFKRDNAGNQANVELKKVFTVAADTPHLTCGRGGITLYDDVILVAHAELGAYIGHDINNGQEVFRRYMGWNTWNAPLVMNDIMYTNSGRLHNWDKVFVNNYKAQTYMASLTINGI